VTTGAISRAKKLQSNHHHQQTNTQFFYRPDALPVAQPTAPNQQCQSTEGKNITFHGLAYPKLTWGSSNFSPTMVIQKIKTEKQNKYLTSNDNQYRVRHFLYFRRPFLKFRYARLHDHHHPLTLLVG